MPNPVEDAVLFSLGPFPVSRIMVVTWCVMGAIITFAGVLRAMLRTEDPGRAQQVMEAILGWLADEIRGIIGRKPEPFIPLVASLFIFILVANLTSLVSPLVPGLKPPTADVTTAAALASVVFLAVPFYGIAITGTVSYLKTYVKPVFIMLPFNIISDVSRTLALAVRLFGNMLSGEILFGVILALVPLLLPLPLMFLSLITGTIQAYIFAVLTIVYIGGAVKVTKRHEAKEAAR
ncbi:MAG: F0F1 ATP synthase subunit A [Planctomycetota bacterium]|jgi:F-type H+-transporting ATPase subunit a